MAATRKILAIDIGAESGRGILGLFDGSSLGLQEVHRFANVPAAVHDRLYWDVLRLYSDVLEAVRRGNASAAGLDSVGIDTWAVDFGLIGADGALLGNPRHYRDPHTEGVMEEAFKTVPRAELYRRTGLQFLRFNTLFQLAALKRDRSPLLDAAEGLLFVPDLLHYFLTGTRANEATNASTSQMMDPATRAWDRDLPRAFGLPDRVLGELVRPGANLGGLRPAAARETGAVGVPVVAPATHDTAAAVAAVPAGGGSWAYISSGTWSLMGIETRSPVVTEASLADNFTNEGGVEGTTRFLKNVMGLWLVQECRRSFERAGRHYDYPELTTLAEKAPPFAALIDPDAGGFLLPADMPAAVADFCRRTGQTPPADDGSFVRTCLEALALKYRWVLGRLEAHAGRRLDAVHVVGGGCKNRLLCQFTADACGRPVVAGPVEATAIGNVLTQGLGLGLVGSLAELREVVRRSFEVEVYEPRDPARWDDAAGRWARMIG